MSVRAFGAWASTKAMNCDLCKYATKKPCPYLAALRMEVSETGEVCRCADYWGAARDDTPKQPRFAFVATLEDEGRCCDRGLGL
jgi:hypothetical protein